MGLLDNPDDNTFKRYHELCSDLNMDKDAANEAWESYERIRQNYILEGDQIHWLGCALYVACRTSTIPTVGRPLALIEGNCVSLTRLLRLCKLSLIQFFNKSKKWADMTNMPAEFRNKIERLERNFAVSMVIFKKFQPIFVDLFHKPNEEQPRQPRSRKQRCLPCNSSKVFDFCWTLFVCVKSEFLDISDDLVNSYHLLLVCCDLIFGNALLADRRDILNSNFPGLPSNFWSPDYSPPENAPCIIDHLCTKHDGIPLEAKSIKGYYWKLHIAKLFERRILKGESRNFSGLLEQGVFEQNLKAINKTYEEYVLSVGDFDERIFLDEYRRLQAMSSTRRSHMISAIICAEPRHVLRDWNAQGEDANADIGTPTKMWGLGEFTEQIQAKRNLQQFGGQMHHLAPSTPLTGRKYLKTKETIPDVTPVSTATQSVSRLQSMLVGKQACPSETLLEIFKSCSRNPKNLIEQWIKVWGNQFCQQYTQQLNDLQGINIDFARKRLQLGQSLYFKILENIVVDEKKKKPGFDLTNLLEQEVFHLSLFACCIEIVIYSYNSQRTFPWILEALNLDSYYFYKVIEPIVRTEDQLSRDMVKHLNLIEEQILEGRAWLSGSPLWESIQNSGLPVPSCEEVSFPDQFEDSNSIASNQNPVMHNITKVQKPQQNTEQQTVKLEVESASVQSPVSSMSERFQSPVPANSIAKKRLFMDSTTVNSGTLLSPSGVKPGQSLLQASKCTSVNIQTIEGENGQRYIPISLVQGTGSVIIQAQPAVSSTKQAAIQQPIKAEKPKRTGSICLFFRKFYCLASVRLRELCMHLDVKDMDLKRKIWTCFEHSIINHTALMQDRHLDQILMCAVYIVCRVCQTEKTFTEIMRCYRLQPQAASHVYRSVLLCSKQRKGGGSSNGTSTTSSPVPSETEYKEAVRSRLEELCLGQGLFADIVFQLDDGSYAAHRPMLMARCDMMKAMFSGDFRESSAKVIMFPGVREDTFHQLLVYLYTDDVPVIAPSRCLDILELGNRLCLPRLVNLVECRVVEELTRMAGADNASSDIVVEHCLRLLEPCKLHNADQLADWCMNHLCTNYNKLCKMSPKLLRTLHPENQEYLSEHRWPPIWYLKDYDYYQKCVVEREKEEKPSLKRGRHNSGGCLCFTGGKTRRDATAADTGRATV